jgi:hypothetical protein
MKNLNKLKFKIMTKVTFIDVFSGDWIITNIMQGYNGQFRVDAKRRFPMADEERFFSKWGTHKYLNSLALEWYGQRLADISAYSY